MFRACPSRVTLAVAVVACSACGGAKVAHVSRPVPAAAWKAVIRDWYDGGIDHRHSCAAVEAAIHHLPVDATYSSAHDDLTAYAHTVC